MEYKQDPDRCVVNRSVDDGGDDIGTFGSKIVKQLERLYKGLNADFKELRDQDASLATKLTASEGGTAKRLATLDSAVKTAQGTADKGMKAASVADAKAVKAQSTADGAVRDASAADAKAVKAQSTAESAGRSASVADAKAVKAQSTAESAGRSASTADAKAVKAQATANRALTPNKLYAEDNVADFAVGFPKSRDMHNLYLNYRTWLRDGGTQLGRIGCYVLCDGSADVAKVADLKAKEVFCENLLADALVGKLWQIQAFRGSGTKTPAGGTWCVVNVRATYDAPGVQYLSGGANIRGNSDALGFMWRVTR